MATTIGSDQSSIDLSGAAQCKALRAQSAELRRHSRALMARAHDAMARANRAAERGDEINARVARLLAASAARRS